MRVLIVTPFPLVASQSGIYSKDIATYLTNQGDEVLVVNFDNEETTYNEQFKITTLFFGNNKIPFKFPCFTTHPHTDKNFYQMTLQEIETYEKYLNIALSKIIEYFKPDIIHSQYLWINTKILGEIKNGIPLVSTSFGNEIQVSSEDIRYEEYVNKAVEYSRFIVAPSKQIELLLREKFKLDAVKLKLIYKGYDDDQFKFIDDNFETYREYFGISDEIKYIVLFPESLNYMKGADISIGCAKKILEIRKDICFIFTGKGDFRKEIEDLVKTDHKHFLYFPDLTYEERPTVFHIADLVVLPLRFEQFGTIALQSFAMGTPVLSSDVGELQFFVNNENGKVLKEINIENFYKGIIEMIEKNFKKKCSLFCHQYAFRNFSKNSGLALLKKLYEYALTEKY
ncbi:MAG: glycosyltransferase family 4 protein [candidate division WOR-3 bacterium]